MDYHIIALDYRGFGDSSSVAPSEEGLVADVKVVFLYLHEKAGKSPLFVWGHSLGTGVACHALSELCQEGKCPQGLVLEAPFNNLHDEIKLNPLSRVFYSLPYFDWAFIDPIRDSGNEFKSDIHVTHISCPMLISTRKMTPWCLCNSGERHGGHMALAKHNEGEGSQRKSETLYKAAQKARVSGAMPVTYVEVLAKYGCGHLDIPRAPEFTSTIRLHTLTYS
ncbi:Monoacylglycerol lipase ABHD12 [Chionoecetes opilio]|uniref:Monoacylglycerol lipase ABHD12 n=1 Tax=Chionoecetes opilio TaxID=41210 RepID=A0A8J4YCD0_CHIOP|nr:Monoacylglycerol lipase ABHD12 [Chionoecetes opilio]